MAPLLALTISLLVSQYAAVYTGVTMYRNVALDNALFSEHVLFVTKARSGLDCSRLCDVYPTCLTFTFMGKTCQGHSEILTSEIHVQQSVPGAKTFSRRVADLVRCRSSGLQMLNVSSLDLNKQVFCDGDWLVMMRRKDGTVDFYRDWQQYQAGFGNLQGEFWLGLDPLYKITNTQVYDLTIELGDWDGNFQSLLYTNFSVTSPTEFYQLHVDFVQGTVNDSLSLANGQSFSTFDADHDNTTKKNCAVKHHGAWWYKSCTGTNLCGQYMPNSSCPLKNGITWKDWLGTFYSLKFAQMKIRPA